MAYFHTKDAPYFCVQIPRTCVFYHVLKKVRLLSELIKRQIRSLVRRLAFGQNEMMPRD